MRTLLLFRHLANMAPRKWSFLLLLGGLLLIGLPNKVNPYAHSKETKTASVKDCKVHIEKALEQYWEHGEHQNPNILSHQTQNLKTPIQVYNKVSTESDSDDAEDNHDDVYNMKNNEDLDNNKNDETDKIYDDDCEDKSGTESQVSEISIIHEKENDSAEKDSINLDTSTSEIREKEENENNRKSNLKEEEDDKSVEYDNLFELGTQHPVDNQDSEKVTEEVIGGVAQKLFAETPSIELRTASEEYRPLTPENSRNLDEDEPFDLVPENTDDEAIENMFEEDDNSISSSTVSLRNRDHVDIILGLDEIGTEVDQEEEVLAQSIFRDIKKIEQLNIKPMEVLYKYTDSTTRVFGDAEIFNKPMLLFLGPWNSGKTSIINYLLGIERTPEALKTGTGIPDVDFTLLTYGEKKQTISGTELAVDWRYSGVQKFGQGFLDHFRNIQMPSILLKKVNIVDTPGVLENQKTTERGYAFNDALQWFIDRADVIYVVLDPTKVDIGGVLGAVLDQLKGHEVRFILNKADTIRRSDLMRVVSQLFWNLSPLMSSTEAPIIYAVSLSTKPFHPSAPVRFLADQENNFLYDMKKIFDKHVENRILYARRHAVRVRNHAKMVDCYLATYYRTKSIFSSKKKIAKQITENPKDYNIFEGIGHLPNISRYDLPDPIAYKTFFKQHPLYDFKPLASTCSYFRGCPMDKLDEAIAHEIPELFKKYKKAKDSFQQEKR